MAKQKPNSGNGEINKSQAIRDMMAQNPNATSKEIGALLADKGIKVRTQLIYVLKSQLKNRRRKQRKERAETVSKEMGVVNPVQLVLSVKSLARDAGGLKTLKKLVDAIAE